MRKTLFSGLFTLVLSASTLQLQAWPVNPGVSGTLDIGAGYRNDRLGFSFRDEDTNDILAKCHWDDLEITQVMIRGHIKGWDRLYAKMDLDYGEIAHGRNQTHRFGRVIGDEISVLKSQSNQGHVCDALLAFGVNMMPWRSCVEIVPLLGYSFHQQKLENSTGVQTFTAIPGVHFPVPHLDVDYKSTWFGPYGGIDVATCIGCNVRIDASYEFHWAAFKGKGKWEIDNRRDSFPSEFLSRFRQNAHGTGNVGRVGVYYLLDGCPTWGVGIVANVQSWRTFSKGDFHSLTGQSTNINTLSNPLLGTIPVVGAAKLDPVEWNSYAISFVFHGEF